MKSIKLLPQEVCVVDRSSDADIGENCGYHFSVRLLSEEGYEIVWKKEQADYIRDTILKCFQ